MAFRRLTDACRSQEKELECIKRELECVKIEACRMEEKLKCERDTLCHELEIKCQKLREIEIEYDEVRQCYCEEKANVCRLETQIDEMRQIIEKERCEANAKIQKLKAEICMKDERLCQMKSHIADLIRENECKCAEINALKSKVQANECLLEKIKHSSEVFDQMKNNKVDQLEREKCEMENDLKLKKQIIGDMKREACRLKNVIKNRDSCNSCPIERDMCCKIIKKVESVNIPSSCFPICPVSKCETSCVPKCRSSTCCPSLPKAPFCGGCPQDKKCNVSSCCTFSRPNKCPMGTMKTCKGNDENKVLSELKRLYCDLEQLKDSTKSRMTKC